MEQPNQEFKSVGKTLGHKLNSWQLMLLVTFVASSLLFIFSLARSLNKPLVAQNLAWQNQAAAVINPGSPIRLIIPAINVNAVVQYVGTNPKKEMGVPNNTIDVAWFDLGPKPGDPGSAVISGHFNGKNNKTGVFNKLDKLKTGDKVQVVTDLGVNIFFTVKASRTYDPGIADEVFFTNDGGMHLNLITCDGIWDNAKNSYNKRLVVFADTP